MAEQTNQPVNLPVKLMSQLCDELERAELAPGEVKRDSYPVVTFGGRDWYEQKDGRITKNP